MGVREITVEGIDCSLAGVAHDNGSGQSPLLALHGWLDNAASYSVLAPLLTASSVLAMDFAGHGLSGHRPPRARTHYIDHVGDVDVFSRALGFERFVLMGHSMGAGVATYYAGTFPERVSHLILIEGLGSPVTSAADAPATLRQSITDQQKRSGKLPVYASMKEAIAARQKGIGNVSQDAATRLCERGVMPVEGGYTWRTDPRLRWTSSLRLTQELALGFIRAIRCPVLLIRGEQGFLVQEELYAERIAALQQVEVITLPGGHHLHMEPAASAMAQRINDFIRSA